VIITGPRDRGSKLEVMIYVMCYDDGSKVKPLHGDPDSRQSRGADKATNDLINDRPENGTHQVMLESVWEKIRWPSRPMTSTSKDASMYYIFVRSVAGTP